MWTRIYTWWRKKALNSPKDLTDRYFPYSRDGLCIACHTYRIGMDMAERYCDRCLPPDEKVQMLSFANTLGARAGRERVPPTPAV
jgi:hypothetical protein